MSPENDQTRWVGIRPVNPPETIPVSIAAWPLCAKVEPCAANNAFNTLTRKIAPAVSDLQAIEAQIEYSFEGASGAVGTITKDSGAVPAGKLWILNHAIMWNDSGLLTLAQIILKSTTTEMKIMIGKAPAERVLTIFTGHIVMKPTEYVRFMFYGVPANDHTLVATMRAYQVSQYT